MLYLIRLTLLTFSCHIFFVRSQSQSGIYTSKPLCSIIFFKHKLLSFELLSLVLCIDAAFFPETRIRRIEKKKSEEIIITIIIFFLISSSAFPVSETDKCEGE